MSSQRLSRFCHAADHISRAFTVKVVNNMKLQNGEYVCRRGEPRKSR